MAAGNYGDIKALGDGVWEARIDWGPGYRIYYAQADLKIILLLLGGDKRKQASDVQLAKDYLSDWQLRNQHK
jgi:putative addiction module killer protein